jgi:uncharacterized protein (DUF1778 family)
MKKRRGRPELPVNKAKAELLSIRFSPTEKKALKRASKGVGSNLSQWARETLLSAALGEKATA